ADTERTIGNVDAATTLFKRVLAIDPANVRAQVSIEEMAMDQRHKKLVGEADGLLKQNNVAAAEQRLRAVRAENPNERDAKSMQRRIDDNRVKQSLAAKSLKADLKRPISLDFRDASLRAVFEAISRTANINYVFDRDVRPDIRVTIQLRNKPIENAVK